MSNSGFSKKFLFILSSISILVYFLIICLQTPVSAKTDEINSLVKVYTVSAEPYYYEPWSMNSISFSSGSGCVIQGNRILTNAHVVSNQTFVQVQLYGKPEKHTARIIAVSHEADLAVLTIDNISFFKGVKPLAIGKLPEIQQDVVVYGFPKGGDTLSVTKGVVSRVEHSEYVHSQLKLLTVQIDAPINAGNSGGPVIVDHRISGIVMQGIDNSQSIGYMVPATIIDHFLTDLKDNHYDGFPTLGIDYQTIENDALKKKYKLLNGQSGVLITFIYPGSSAHGILQTGDILLSLENHDISGDGTVEFRPSERTAFQYYVQNHQKGDNLNLKILRNGEVHSVRVVLSSCLGTLNLVPRQQYDIKPSYFIYGGLLFRPLTKNYLLGWSDGWDENAPHDFAALYKQGRPESKGSEIVILSKVLASDVNSGYHNYSDMIITHVNGKKIKNLKKLVNTVRKDRNREFMEFQTKSGFKIIIDRKQAENDLPGILKTYNVPHDRSEQFR